MNRFLILPTAFVICLFCSCIKSEENAATESNKALVELQKEREELDKTVFANETKAVQHEQVFITLWDRLRNEDPLKVLNQFEFKTLIFGNLTPQESPDWGIEGITIGALNGTEKKITREQYQILINNFYDEGWRLNQSEWHHSKFIPAENNEPARSIVSCEMHCTSSEEEKRVIIRGKIKVTWSINEGEYPTPDTININDLQIISRQGKKIFQEAMNADPKIEAPGRFPRFSPIMVYDLDGDGLNEIIAGGCNLIYKNQGDGKYTKKDFLLNPIVRPAEAGLLADMNGDGNVDFICGNSVDGSLLLFLGDKKGFNKAPIKFNIPPLQGLHALSAADIDGDNDLDLFVGQWKAPYIGGSMPTPYYDANDGYPDYLLRNDGNHIFIDITNQSGLAKKRDRRTFSASLVDLNFDTHPDLVVVADFSGLDFYINDGKGNFTDKTADFGDEKYAFGMSHTFGDWDGDGIQDLCLVGMSSTTARRLDGLGITKPGYEKYSLMRAPMTYGNRLYTRDSKGNFTQPKFTASAARSGWSWGCTATDFDLDGDTDLYVVNGHISGNSAKDYCTRFWCHDLYTGNSKPNTVLDDLFQTELLSGLGKDFSWNGFEHNAMYLNQSGKDFLNAGFLLGSAFEYDSRSVLATDMDENGTQDLIVVEYNAKTMSQRLHIYKNTIDSDNSWIGINLADNQYTSPVGSVITARSQSRNWSKIIVNGDGFTSQGPSRAHFGLGKIKELSEIQVVWPNGKKTILKNPKINQYHQVSIN
ncbi:MAG: CRTAC1 family protein [Verrucomicrobiota bacterium]|nr:CRTAC1 family protein [Verrucomicrobiota bacterium]